MKSIGLGYSLAGAMLLATAAGAWSQDSHSSTASSILADSPYAIILARNSFGLLPILREPVEIPAPPEAPPIIIPTGAMHVFGRDQALFQVASQSKSGQPLQGDAYVLAAGECRDGIRVVKIDVLAGVITFDNHGTLQELTLKPGIIQTRTGRTPKSLPIIAPD